MYGSTATHFVAGRGTDPERPADAQLKFVLRRPDPEHQTLKDIVSKPYWWARGGGAPVSMAKGSLHPVARFGPGLMFASIASLVFSSRFGSESLVRAGGPLPAILGMALLPWVWFGPTSLAVGELATAVPSNAGPQMWANVALGTFWAFVTSYMTLFINVLVLAAASAVFADYIGMAASLPTWANLCVRAGVLIISAALNCVSVDGVTFVLYAITVLSIVPFVVMPFWQLFGGQPTSGANWNAMGQIASPFNLPLYMTFLSFTHEGVENVGSVVEETKNPARSIKLVILPTIVLSHIVYLFPFMAGVSAYANAGLVATNGYALWVTGYWSNIAAIIGGRTLQIMMLGSGIGARFGASLSVGAAAGRMLAGMGTLDVLPSAVSDFLAQYHKTSYAPINAIGIVTLLSLPLALPFHSDELMALSQVFIAARLLVIYASFIALRVRFPTLNRPFKYPIKSSRGAVWSLLPSMIFSLGVVVAAAFLNFMVCVVSLIAGAVMVAGAALSTKFFRPNGLYGTVEPDLDPDWAAEERRQMTGGVGSDVDEDGRRLPPRPRKNSHPERTPPGEGRSRPTTPGSAHRSARRDSLLEAGNNEMGLLH